MLNNIYKKNQRFMVYSILILALFVLLYFRTFGDLILVWMSNEDYGHGFLILPITLYLIWRKREELLDQPINPSRWGIGIILLWIIFYTIGLIGHISTIEDLSMLIFPIGAVAVLISGQAARLILFPIFFMIFMFPIPSELYTRVTNPLLLISTKMSFHILSILNLPIMQEGNLLTLPNYTMHVILACSGIRSLVSIMALAFLVGYIMTPSNLLRLIFFLISIPIAILGNVVRISITALLAYFVSPGAAEGYSHTFAGLVTFALSFIILFGCMEFILWCSRKRKPSSSS